MFDKAKYNNWINNHKPKIKQSRVQTINNLVHKLRKLKATAEKQTENAKTTEKINKIEKQINHLKVLKQEELVKSVLLLDNSPTKIISNGNSSQEEVAIAALALNKVMASLTKNLSAEFGFSGTDDTWKKALKEIHAEKNKAKAKKEQKEKKAKLKEEKNEKQAKLKQDKTAKEDKEKKNLKSKLENSKKAEAEVAASNNKHLEPHPCASDESENEIEPETTAPDDIAAQVEPRKSESRPETNIVEPTKSKLEKSKIKKIIKAAKPAIKEVKVRLVPDPMLLEEDGTPYMAYDFCLENDNEKATTNKFKQSGKFDKNRHYRGTDEEEEPHNKRRKYNSISDDSSNAKEHDKKLEIAPEDLHPSWAAKQKLKPVIASFQGKKIKFDE